MDEELIETKITEYLLVLIRKFGSLKAGKESTFQIF